MSNQFNIQTVWQRFCLYEISAKIIYMMCFIHISGCYMEIFGCVFNLLKSNTMNLLFSFDILWKILEYFPCWKKIRFITIFIAWLTLINTEKDLQLAAIHWQKTIEHCLLLFDNNNSVWLLFWFQIMCFVVKYKFETGT